MQQPMNCFKPETTIASKDNPSCTEGLIIVPILSDPAQRLAKG